MVSGGKITQSGAPSEIFMHASGSQKLSIPARLLELKDEGAIFIAVVQIAQSLGEVALSPLEASGLKIGDEILISTKAFKASIKKL